MYVHRLFSQTAARYALLAASQEALQNTSEYAKTRGSIHHSHSEQQRLDRAYDHCQDALKAIDRALNTNL